MVKRIPSLRGSACAAALWMVLASGASATTIETVYVGHPGNPGELAGESAGGHGHDRICGSVDHPYRIGTYEVTAGQYCDFLNAVAGVDTYGLYSTSMWTSPYGCKIERHAGSGIVGDPYRYRISAAWANRPVNYVTWGDATRFANWLHNDQPTGAQGPTTTEDGAYALHGATSAADLLAVSREADWKWAIPTEDEWYKAAYHKNDGRTAHYFDYPTSSDTAPGFSLIDPDAGNNASFCGVPASPYYRTEVGEHENSASPYGTFDQGGNIYEWVETFVRYGNDYRGMRGGSYDSPEYNLRASHRNDFVPSFQVAYLGFRVVQVPEPATVMLLACGAAWTLGRRPGRRVPT